MEIKETSRGLMVSLTLALPKGLHARPSAKVAQIARRYAADILLKGENGEVDAKSMLDVLSLSSPPHARLEVIARGPDARGALIAIYDFLTCAKDADGQENP